VLAALIIFGIAQALLLSVVLWTTRRGYRPANRLLAAITLTIGIHIALSQLVRSGFVLRFPHIIRSNHPLDFVHGSLFYLYIRTLTDRRQLRRRDLLHFVPAVACAVYLLPYYFHSGAYKLTDLKSPAYASWYYLRSGLAIGIGGCYVVAGLRLALKNRNADSQLRFVSIAFGAVLAVAAGRYVFDFLFPAFTPLTNWFLPIIGAGILYGMTYIGLRDPAVTVQKGRKYETSSLTKERADLGLQALVRALENDKVFLDPDITLNSLADRLGIPVPHLSQIVNERLNQTFSDLINSHRVEEVKRRFADPACRHYSLLAIAEEVGFRSKSSFNTVFKKYTRMTPSDYRKTTT
jgi:AraC-like DNA-binding protein